MTGKEAGFVVARALAILLGLQSLYALLSSIVWISGPTSWGNPLSRALPAFIQPVVYQVVALILWRIAPNFGPPSNEAEVDPLTTRSALSTATLGIAIFMIFSHIEGGIDYLLDQSRPVYWGDLATVIAGAIVIPFAWKQMIDVRTYRQERREESAE